jgi:rhodanese-related sulfurtransferase
LRRLRETDRVHLIDLRSSAAYRTGHPEGAHWSIRPRVIEALGNAPRSNRVVLLADSSELAALAAADLRDAGFTSVSIANAGIDTFEQAGYSIGASPASPSDSERIDSMLCGNLRVGRSVDGSNHQ